VPIARLAAVAPAVGGRERDQCRPFGEEEPIGKPATLQTDNDPRT
jgi:hypothetical protein